MSTPPLTPALLLKAYRNGLFPMRHDDGELYWHDPDPRAIFPLEGLRPNARSRRWSRSSGYTCTVDTAFQDVMQGCAARTDTWIDAAMIDAYSALHRQGYARSVETWHEGILIGGIYGVHLGRAFFGESMFSRRTQASRMAFHHLADLLRAEGVLLFDTQYINDHTRSLGAVEIPRSRFRRLLAEALMPQGSGMR